MSVYMPLWVQTRKWLYQYSMLRWWQVVIHNHSWLVSRSKLPVERMITWIFSLYRVVFTRKVSNTIKDRQPKLGKYFKPWNNITNGTLNPTDNNDITISPKSTEDEKYDEFIMNGEFSVSCHGIRTKFYFQNFSKIMVAMQMIAIVRLNSLKNSMKSQ